MTTKADLLARWEAWHAADMPTETLDEVFRDALSLIPDDPAAGVPQEVQELEKRVACLKYWSPREFAAAAELITDLWSYIRSLAPQPAALPMRAYNRNCPVHGAIVSPPSTSATCSCGNAAPPSGAEPPKEKG